MSDIAVPESGTDFNAIRFNMEVGESREYEIAFIYRSEGQAGFTIGAWITDTDVDGDNCAIEGFAEGEYPKRGMICKFTRTESQLIVSPLNSAVASEGGAVDEESNRE